MKAKVIIIFLITSSINSLIAQDFILESIGIHLFPDVSMVDRNLLDEEATLINQFKIGYGLGLEISSQFKKRYHLKFGLNIVNRRFGSIGFLNQSKLPSAQRSFTRELVTVEKLSYQVFEIPFKAGITTFKKGNLEHLLYLGGSFNFMLSGNYKTNNSRYDGLYKKSGLKGFTGLLGMQLSYAFKKNWNFIYRLEQSLFNKIGEDSYINNNGQPALSVSHRFFRLIIGMEIRV